MSKPRTKPKYSHVERVNALFDQIYKAAPAGSDWLTALRQRALNKEVGWKSDADSYVNGLADAGAITPESAAACRDSLERCLDSDPGGREILLPMIWIAIVAAMTMSSQAIANDTAFITLLAVLTSAAGGLWASKRPWLDYRNDPRQQSWKRPIVIIVCAVLVTLLTYFIPFAVGLIIQRVSIEQFNADRAAFLSDQQGFPLLRKLAREQYGVEVVLGDAYRSWAPTTVNLPNSSVALMELQPGYCHLSMRRANTLRGFDPVSSVDSVLWVQGVMMHEFAHCLDGLRDMPIFGQKIVGTHSLAPVDAKKVRDLEGYLEAETHKSTQLWREAVADTFAVGYWKLTAPIAAGDLVASLRHKRANDAPQDATHATMCWIDYADRTDVPASTADLFEWADHLRTSAPCGQL
jgi:hypothetical protein